MDVPQFNAVVYLHGVAVDPYAFKCELLHAAFVVCSQVVFSN